MPCVVRCLVERAADGNKHANGETTEMQKPKQPYDNPSVAVSCQAQLKTSPAVRGKERSDLATISASTNMEGDGTVLPTLAEVEGQKLSSDIQWTGPWKKTHAR